ncbi:MAG: nucleoside kinase [Kiritimatiellae bacterium]|nr:nucleoside kinase [Kiritimatiellia bacterium]
MKRKPREAAVDTIAVTLETGETVRCARHTEVRDLIGRTKGDPDLPYIGALVNNDVTSLSYPLVTDSDVRFLTMRDSYGWRIYRRSVSFMLAKAIWDLYPGAEFSVEHSVGQGFYCNFNLSGKGRTRKGITQGQLKRIEKRMQKLVREDLAIERRKLSFMQAVTLFEEQKQYDKLNTLKFRNPPRIVLHWCDGFSDVAHGPLVPAMGVLAHFRLVHYPPGFVLQFPDRDAPPRLSPYQEEPKLFQIFQEHTRWGRILGVTTAGELNEIIADRQLGEFIKIAEALHEKKIARIADALHKKQEKIRVILVAGPSSSGKTTFSKRLMIQLRVNGLRPVMLSLDDYFVDHAQTPRDEAGNPDFEHIETVDLPLFNKHLAALVKGEEVQLPFFNFEKRVREWRGNTLRIDGSQMLLIEGLHCLNPRLTHAIPRAQKYKIYVSALTQLNVDSHNRVSTTDNRLMRRVVRDNKFRGHSALTTLQMWPSVRRGEKRWIFPFQGLADVMFNSALDYELPILKPMVEPLLMQVKPSDAEYAEARRLTEFLLSFIDSPADDVPRNSILREFIGASGFRY